MREMNRNQAAKQARTSKSAFLEIPQYPVKMKKANKTGKEIHKWLSESRGGGGGTLDRTG